MVISAVGEGIAYPFEIVERTLEQLAAMRTGTTNQQTPVNIKRVDKLKTSLSSTPQITPFSICNYEDSEYLVGGRHRLNVQLDLGRDKNTVFQCILYTVTTAAELNTLIIEDNNTRSTSAPEKVILQLGGEYEVNLLSDKDMLRVFGELVEDKNFKEIRKLILATVMARIPAVERTGVVSQIMCKQILTALWRNTLDRASSKQQLALLMYHPENVMSLINRWVDLLSESFETTVKSHPKITKWAREGKDTLIRDATKVIKDRGFEDLFPHTFVTKTKAKNTKAKAKAKGFTPNKLEVSGEQLPKAAVEVKAEEPKVNKK